MFVFVLGLLEKAHLLNGKYLGIDASGMEANAAMKSIVRWDTGETYQEVRILKKGTAKVYAKAGATAGFYETGITCRPNGRRKATGPTTGNNCGYVNNRANMRANPNASPYSRRNTSGHNNV